MIPTITLWLLVSIGYSGMRSDSPFVTVARFASVKECERVRDVLVNSPFSGNFHPDKVTDYRPDMRCVQATVAKP